jgi:tripeptidyl-peptidase-1
MKVVAALLLLAAAAVSALPSNHYVVHEARRTTGMRRGVWKRASRAAGDSILPLRIGLTQSNLDVAYDRLMDITHPSSENYGKHLTQDEVIDLFAPQEESITAVREWLVQSGVNGTRIKHYKTKGWLSIDMPVREAEKLFQTQYHEVEHQGTIRLGCDEYSVPKHIQEHIDYITPGVKLSPPLRKRSVVTPYGRKRKSFQLLQDPQSFFHIAASVELPLNLQGCAQNFTPVCYQALYDIPANNTALPGNSVGLYESGDIYAQEDSDAFFAKYAPYIPNGTHPIPAFIDGAEAPVAVDSEFNGGESEIDIDIISSLVYPQTITLYQTDDQVQSGTTYGFLNTFLDALDGSYCNYTAYGITGDSPDIDATYPDSAPGGYDLPEMCGVYTPAKVISISYGLAEADYPKAYIERQCNEWMKFGLQGITVLLASGDYGVAGFPGDVTDSGCLSGGNLTETIYNPDSVSSCPYVSHSAKT